MSNRPCTHCTLPLDTNDSRKKYCSPSCKFKAKRNRIAGSEIHVLCSLCHHSEKRFTKSGARVRLNKEGWCSSCSFAVRVTMRIEVLAVRHGAQWYSDIYALAEKRAEAAIYMETAAKDQITEEEPIEIIED